MKKLIAKKTKKQIEIKDRIKFYTFGKSLLWVFRESNDLEVLEYYAQKDTGGAWNDIYYYQKKMLKNPNVTEKILKLLARDSRLRWRMGKDVAPRKITRNLQAYLVRLETQEADQRSKNDEKFGRRYTWDEVW